VTALPESVDLARTAARGALEKLAQNIVALDVSEQLAITDIFLIASASNERQVSAVVDGVDEAMYKIGEKTLRREGESESRWVLLDFGSIVVHVQHEEDRSFYALERLWKDCPVVDLELDDEPRATEPTPSE
jgi:ribosome-associated protein